MIGNLVDRINSIKVGAITKFTDCNEGINDELVFLDDTLIENKIIYVKKLLKMVDEETKYVDNEQEYTFLLGRKKELIYEFVMLASNNFNNLDFCIKVLEPNNKYQKCLQALKISETNELEAKKFFDGYFEQEKFLIENFLICKTYGMILYNFKEYSKAAIFLRKAIELKPQDLDIHIKLKNIYLEINDEILINNEEQIINILKEDEFDE